MTRRLGIDPSDPAVQSDFETLRKVGQPESPPPPIQVGEEAATVILWAFAFAFGVAGVLAWKAPAIVFFWPLGLGGAGAALILVARTLGDAPQWATLAVIAVVGSLIIGVLGLLTIEDARRDLNSLLGVL